MAKRYRFNGKERDEETGLYYYGARYYAAWLARWTSADPLGIGADGPGVYNYTRGSPVTLMDPNGTDATSALRQAEETFEREASAAAKAKDPGAAHFAAVQKLNLAQRSYEESMQRENEEVQALVRNAGVVNARLRNSGGEIGTPEPPTPPSNEELRESVPVLPFFINDGLGGYGWQQSVRTNQQPMQGAPPGLSAIRSLNQGQSLAVAQFSRDYAPGTSVENLTLETVGFGAGIASDVSQAGKATKLAPRLFAVDRAMMAGDEAAGVLVNGKYIKNPTAQNLGDLVTPTGKIGSKRMNGKFMYIVDESGNIVIGSRAGKRMPHPTLVGGSNPQVQAAGIVDIRGGRIYSIDISSGHFKPGPEALKAADDAFKKAVPKAAFDSSYTNPVLH